MSVGSAARSVPLASVAQAHRQDEGAATNDAGTTTTATTPAKRDQVAARWAEVKMTLQLRSATALRGDAAAAHGRSLLEAAFGGPEKLEAAMRRRTTLGADRPA